MLLPCHPATPLNALCMLTVGAVSSMQITGQMYAQHAGEPAPEFQPGAGSSEGSSAAQAFMSAWAPSQYTNVSGQGRGQGGPDARDPPQQSGGGGGQGPSNSNSKRSQCSVQ